jgi:hypothetical protein
MIRAVDSKRHVSNQLPLLIRPPNAISFPSIMSPCESGACIRKAKPVHVTRTDVLSLIAASDE